MKTKILAAFSILSMTVWAATSGSEPLPDGRAPGRFQLAAGTEPGLANEQGVATVFRIDTATGKAWCLRSVPINTGDGKVASLPTWLELDEIDSPLYRAAMQATTKP